jgi:hypothetical protein
MKFKELEINPEKNKFSRIFKSTHLRKTLTASVIGIILASGVFYLTEGRQMIELVLADFLEPALLGAFFGFFITNSPCARNRC